MGLLDTVADRRETLLRQIYEVNKATIDAGRTADVKTIIIPVQTQHDPHEAAHLVARDKHGAAFVAIFIDLLSRYGFGSRSTLSQSARAAGLKVARGDACPRPIRPRLVAAALKAARPLTATEWAYVRTQIRTKRAGQGEPGCANTSLKGER